MIWIGSSGMVCDFYGGDYMVKEVFRLISSVALLAAVIVGVKAADKFVKQLKGEKDEDIIDI